MLTFVMRVLFGLVQTPFAYERRILSAHLSLKKDSAGCHVYYVVVLMVVIDYDRRRTVVGKSSLNSYLAYDKALC